MVYLLAISLAGGVGAEARERPGSKHDNARAVGVFSTREARMQREPSRQITDKTSVSVGVTAGNENNRFRKRPTAARLGTPTRAATRPSS